MISAVHQRLLDDAAIYALLRQAPPMPMAVDRLHDGRAGEFAVPRFGAGMDFAETRVYQPGDDPRQIDWRATARAQSTMARAYYQDKVAPCCLILDRRAAMRFGSRRRLKVTQALRAALLLAGRAARGGQTVVSALLDESLHWLPPAIDINALQPFVLQANTPCPPGTDAASSYSWQKLFAALEQRLTTGGAVTICSDFHGFETDDVAVLRRFAQRFDCRAVLINDPLETDARGLAGFALQWRTGEFEIAAAHDHALFAKEVAARQQWLRVTLAQAGVQVQSLATTDDELDELARGLG